ncbi:PH domain-containing protein [Candidatus Absconditicoccus praedator]|uniref:PH domain-containing protein n=1 Tax=Candidatus Absconditicoccus praedator TaxID=2735562 RepID=UPI001E5135FD|nr:PH domain-containing protein [Candidatus Absconditicoccus praedator]UFX82960.1 PH domain-containing protein [Candidatus Absconditicoccus praedator]
MKKIFPGQAVNEKVLFFGRENILRYIFHNFNYIMIFLGLGFFFSLFLVMFFDLLFATVFFIIFVSFCIGFLFVVFWYNTYLVITNKRIMKFLKNGIFKNSSQEITIYSLQESTYKYNGFLDRILNCGNVSFYGKDQNIVIWFKGIKHPEEVTRYTSRLRDFLIENPNYDYTQISEFIPRNLRQKQKGKK